MINIDELEAMLEDKDLICELFTVYLEDHSDANKTIDMLVKDQDTQGVFKYLHSISGALLNLLEGDIAPQIKEIETNAKKGVLPNDDSIAEIYSGLNSIKLQMQNYLSH